MYDKYSMFVFISYHNVNIRGLHVRGLHVRGLHVRGLHVQGFMNATIYISCLMSIHVNALLECSMVC